MTPEDLMESFYLDARVFARRLTELHSVDAASIADMTFSAFCEVWDREGRREAAAPVPGWGLSEKEEAAAVLAGDRDILNGYKRQAEAGDPESARRVAELLEFVAEEEAERWWRLAAKLGDRDAIDYLMDEVVDSFSTPHEGK
ncbi:hypothetical protein [Streptomyces griseoruber]|uniref:hypothetical protein n=1 Tax=Streptomyces griseoruber TaxID=1943 RepID=UPI003793137E